MNQDQSEVLAPRRKGRGPSKKGALVYVGVRMEKETLEFYSQFANRQAAMRDALKQYIDQYKQEKRSEEHTSELQSH